jgi:hypothetical protein
MCKNCKHGNDRADGRTCLICNASKESDTTQERIGYRQPTLNNYRAKPNDQRTTTTKNNKNVKTL